MFMNQKDFEGWFLRAGHFGSWYTRPLRSDTIGFGKAGPAVLSYTEAVQSTTGGGVGISGQYFIADVGKWIYDEAPIEWGGTFWDKIMAY